MDEKLWDMCGLRGRGVTDGDASAEDGGLVVATMVAVVVAWGMGVERSGGRMRKVRCCVGWEWEWEWCDRKRA